MGVSEADGGDRGQSSRCPGPRDPEDGTGLKACHKSVVVRPHGPGDLSARLMD
jgi:hypothetical protein